MMTDASGNPQQPPYVAPPAAYPPPSFPPASYPPAAAPPQYQAPAAQEYPTGAPAAPYNAAPYGNAPYGGAPVPPAYGAPAGGPVPGKTLGIVALVVTFFAALIGFILGLVALSQSKKAGAKNTPAKVAVILSIVFMVIGLVASIIIGISFFSVLAQCAEVPPGDYMAGPFPVTCR